MASFHSYVSADPVFVIDPLFSVLRVSKGTRTFIIRISGYSKESLKAALKEGYALTIKIKKSREFHICTPNVTKLFYASYATLTLVRDSSPPKVINGIATITANLAIKNIVRYSENMFMLELARFDLSTFKSHYTPVEFLTENER
jgi:hypothetical protein